MKIKIREQDCRFIVKRDEKVVVCILPKTKFLFIDFINLNLPNFITDEIYEKRLELKNYYVGVAKCSPEDEFNEEIGRRVAFAKLKEKLRAAFYRRADYYIQTYDNFMEKQVQNIDELLDKWTGEIEHERKNIEDYFNNAIREEK